MTSQELKSKIALLQLELKQAQEYEQNLESGSPVAIAEYLHKLQCRWNHTDGCGWDYENWDSPGDTRNRWLKKVERLLELIAKLKISTKDFLKIADMLCKDV